MGVPALFRFLSRKYPKIVSPVREAPTKDSNGDDIAVDISQPNPNGEEFDNLYLDMNGIVHPCSHPEDRPPPQNEDEIMMEIFRYTDRIMAMVRPRKVLMIAVDGVAPRAKMNQQRSRRFRSAQEAEEKEKKREEAVAEILSAGGPAPDEDDDKPWDSNVITPGTPFMDILAASLRYWVQYKFNSDPGWKDLKVIISDASVPGEGEHKIMEFVRSQRADPRHDPNTRHVIYGLDADLIMLGLATHEPYFRVLREDVFFQQNSGGCRNCGQKGHIAAECTTVMEKKVPDKNAPPKPFIWLNVATLREYLEVELHIPGQVVPFDLERALDDWVFIIFFVGNDFLPHLPSLDIREGAIDALVSLWKKNLDVQGGYITCDGTMNLQRAQFMLDGLAEQEEEIFRRRKQTEERNEQRDRDRAQSRKDNKAAKKLRESGDFSANDNVSIVPAPTSAAVIEKAPVPAPVKSNKGSKAVPEFHDLNQTINGSALSNKDIVANRKALRTGDTLEANMSAAAKLKAQLLKPKEEPQEVGNKTPEPVTKDAKIEPTTSGKKRAFGEFTSDGLEPVQNPEMVDTVRLWEDGYKERYYVQKFKCDPDDIEFRRSIARDYVEGLAWVLLYYYQGCHSWTWFYPHHYAPFASDFDQIAKLDISFTKGEPARPYEQLLGVMPVASNHVLPEPLRKLMTDEEYGITDFYPLDFPVDLNGKKFAWQGVVLLPFIDQARLLEACAKGYKLLTPEEEKRNARGYDQLIFSESNSALYDYVVAKLYSKKATKDKASLDMNISGGLGGYVRKDPLYMPNSSIPFPLQSRDVFPDIDMDTSVACKYNISKSKFVHKSMLLKGLRPPPKVLDRRDLDNVRYGSNNGFGGNHRNNDRYGNNNRARDVQDPTQHKSAPSSNNGAPIPPWAAQQQPQPYGSGYGNYGSAQPTGQHTYFAAPPPLQNGVPVPIPGFPPPVSARPPPQSQGSGYGQSDPFSRYQSSGYGGFSGNGQNGGHQNWQGYQH